MLVNNCIQQQAAFGKYSKLHIRVTFICSQIGDRKFPMFPITQISYLYKTGNYSSLYNMVWKGLMTMSVRDLYWFSTLWFSRIIQLCLTNKQTDRQSHLHYRPPLNHAY